MTGGVEEGETWEETIRRESREETGLTIDHPIIDADFEYTFNENGRTHTEKVFAVELPLEATITISYEHSEFQWATAGQANNLLHWEGNKKGLQAVIRALTGAEEDEIHR